MQAAVSLIRRLYRRTILTMCDIVLTSSNSKTSLSCFSRFAILLSVARARCLRMFSHCKTPLEVDVPAANAFILPHIGGRRDKFTHRRRETRAHCELHSNGIVDLPSTTCLVHTVAGCRTHDQRRCLLATALTSELAVRAVGTEFFRNSIVLSSICLLALMNIPTS
eukprot:SAG31_NODE_2004_length_6685_cov_2.189341_5_plen_166_part_00